MEVDIFGREIVKKRKVIERDVLTEIFVNNLRGITEEELVLMMYSKFEAIIDFARLCRGEATGQKISSLFNPHRFSIKCRGRKSLVSVFASEKTLSDLARAVILRESDVKNVGNLLKAALGIHTGGSQWVAEFPPYVARDFYIAYNAKSVLDPCAGWGGRMLGAASVGAFYHAFDPSTKTYEGLLKLGEFLKPALANLASLLSLVPG